MAIHDETAATDAHRPVIHVRYVALADVLTSGTTKSGRNTHPSEPSMALYNVDHEELRV
jgi:hypothetical protein